MLHEWDILAIRDNKTPQVSEYYVIIAIFGVEYAINLGRAELDGFHQWLKDNNYDSFLYSKKRKSIIMTDKGHGFVSAKRRIRPTMRTA